MVRIIKDLEGNEYISRLASWMVWRKMTNDFSALKDAVNKYRPAKDHDKMFGGLELIVALNGGGPGSSTSCPFCGGAKAFHDNQHGDIYCICYLLDYQKTLANRLREYRTPFDIDSVMPIETMETRNNKTMKKAIESSLRFLNDLDVWILLGGLHGLGKSNILQNIATRIGPIALYLSADHFERVVFDKTRAGTLSEMIDDISRVPVLLLDDYGIEYGAKNQAGDSYVISQIRSIINYRYAMWREYPTFIVTNIPIHKLSEKDSWIDSRIRDNDKAEVIDLSQLTDYRLISPNRKNKG